MDTLRTSFVDALIIGAGPAGLAAALSLCRIRRTAPSDFRASALKEILGDRYNTVTLVKVLIQSVTRDSEDGTFTAKDETGRIWYGKRLIIASGVTDILPEIPGYAECWNNNNIYPCLFFNGYEDSGAYSAAVLAIGSMASPASIQFAKLAARFAIEVTIYTNNSKALAISFMFPLANCPNISIDNRPIKALIPGTPEKGPSIVLGSDEVIEHAFFTHLPKHSLNIDFAKGLGLTFSDWGTEIKTTGTFYETEVKGCFAVGDNSAKSRTVIMAMASGIAAASGVAMSI